MDPNKLFKRGCDEYNLWYKFIDSEYYNYIAYNTFAEALTLYISNKNYDKASLCYKWIFASLENSENRNHIVTLANMYEEYANFIKVYYQSKDSVNYFMKAVKLYSSLGHNDDIIRIKIKVRGIIRLSIEKQLNLLSVHQRISKNYLENCSDSFDKLQENVSEEDTEKNINQNISLLMANLKTQEVLANKIDKNTKVYINLGHDITEYKMKSDYDNFRKNNKRGNESNQLFLENDSN